MLNLKNIVAAFTYSSILLFAPVAEAQFRTSATFYSDRLIGRKMANGRPYRSGHAIAAHPSLKLGTKVKVTNIKTGRSVVVTITDRCNCGIDLSKGAFGMIAPHRQGRVPVRVTIVR